MVAVGRLAPEKQFVELVEMWNIFRREFPEWKLNIYGEGPERNNIENTIKKLGLVNSVILCGFEPNIVQAINDASAMLMTSKFEGFGIVIIEAFSVGIPVISFETDGAKSLIENEKDGLLIPLGNQKGYVDAMCKLAKDYKLRVSMSEKCIEKAGLFTKNVIFDKWHRQIKIALEEKNEK